MLVSIVNATAFAQSPDIANPPPVADGTASEGKDSAAAPGGAAPEPGPETEVTEKRRDPFRPFTLSLKKDRPDALAPLQKYQLRELTLTAVMWNLNPPRALVQDKSGMGFVLTPGTLIGPNRGVVAAIEPRQVIVEEKVMDEWLHEQLKRETLEIPEEEQSRDARRGRR